MPLKPDKPGSSSPETIQPLESSKINGTKALAVQVRRLLAKLGLVAAVAVPSAFYGGDKARQTYREAIDYNPEEIARLLEENQAAKDMLKKAEEVKPEGKEEQDTLEKIKKEMNEVIRKGKKKAVETFDEVTDGVRQTSHKITRSYYLALKFGDKAAYWLGALGGALSGALSALTLLWAYKKGKGFVELMDPEAQKVATAQEEKINEMVAQINALTALVKAGSSTIDSGVKAQLETQLAAMIDRLFTVQVEMGVLTQGEKEKLMLEMKSKEGAK